MKKTLAIVFVAALMAGFWSGCKKDGDGNGGNGGNGESPGKQESGAKLETTAGTATAQPQEVCPLGKGAIDKNSFADYKGKRVYLCGDGCKPEFKKNADKIIADLEAEGVELAAAE